MKVGIDLVDIDDLKTRIARTSNFLDKLLSEIEQDKKSLESMAGRIAAKEAVMKTGFIGIGEWLNIHILSNIDGSPYVADQSGKKIDQLNISITHTKHTAAAVAIYEDHQNN